jgi:hypothetical protein
VAATASSSDTTAYRSLGWWSGLGDGRQRVGAAIQRQGGISSLGDQQGRRGSAVGVQAEVEKAKGQWGTSEDRR